MTTKPRLTRRAVLAGTGAAVASPYVWTSAHAQAGSAIKIGMPLALTGPLGSVGQQQKRGADKEPNDSPEENEHSQSSSIPTHHESDSGKHETEGGK